VDRDGNPAWPGSVIAEATGAAKVPLVQAQIEKDGQFEIAGLSPSSYAVYATSYLQQSDPVDVTIADEDSPEPLRLVLRDEQKVSGRVVSDVGPVPGAQVLLMPTDVPVTAAGYNFTNEIGEFAATVAPKARQIDIFVASAGYAYRMTHTGIQSGGLTLKLDQQSGVLVIPGPTHDFHPILHHAGAWRFAEAIALEWPATQLRVDSIGKAQMILPGMEPGPYRVCLITFAQLPQLRFAGALPGCADGFLAPYGQLELSPTSGAEATSKPGQ